MWISRSADHPLSVLPLKTSNFDSSEKDGWWARIPPMRRAYLAERALLILGSVLCSALNRSEPKEEK